jgi:hypothetical protein
VLEAGGLRVVDVEELNTHGGSLRIHARPADNAGEPTVRLRRRLELGEAEFVAFLGTIEARKNVSALIRGWVAAVRPS